MRLVSTKFQKRHYKRTDLPDMIAYDIMNQEQLRAMANLAEI